MTTTAPATGTPTRELRVSLPRVMRSELTKMRTLRSTVWSLVVTLGFILGFSILVPAVIVSQWPPTNAQDALTFNPVSTALAGVGLAQMAVGVLGVLLMSGEYSTGMIRATLAAVPKRLPVLWAKTTVFVAVLLALLVPALVAAFFIGQAIFKAESIDTGFGEPGVARVVFGSALYLAGIGVFGMILGSLMRHTAGAISVLFGVLLVLPIITFLLPRSVGRPIFKYLPGTVGGSVSEFRENPDLLAPWTGFGVFCLYLLAGLAAAAYLLRRRDA